MEARRIEGGLTRGQNDEFSNVEPGIPAKRADEHSERDSGMGAFMRALNPPVGP